MAKILLAKHEAAALTDSERETVRRVLFGMVNGIGEDDRKRWRQLWNWLLKAEPGEMVELYTRRRRSSAFNRRHFLIEQAVFDAQEQFRDFERHFRPWLKLGVGFVDWLPGPKGELVPVPKSMSFDELEEFEMRELHKAMVEFLRTPEAAAALWPGRADAVETMDAILTEFNE